MVGLEKDTSGVRAQAGDEDRRRESVKPAEQTGAQAAEHTAEQAAERAGIPKNVDVVVIGGGPAGLAAAVGAKDAGARSVLVLERQSFLGGVLPQCVHDGFGIHIHERALTGPEYAQRWAEAAQCAGAELLLDTTVLGVSRAGGTDGGLEIDAVGESLAGRRTIHAKSVVVATGCRERTRGQLNIAGTRPAGVMTAGCAQYMMNVRNLLPGDKAVILGTGDIGLIMARRLTLEGAQVRMIVGAQATGLLRNHVRCVQDFDIPMRIGWSVVSIHGKGQLTGVTIAPLNEDGSFNMSLKEYIRCNLLLLACGLIPEREIVKDILDDGDLSSIEGLFICGNAQRPHDVVDEVTQDGLLAGQAAANYARNKAADSDSVADGSLSPELQRMATMYISEAAAADSSSILQAAEYIGASETSRALTDHEDSNSVDAASAFDQSASGESVICTMCPVGCTVKRSSTGMLSGYSCMRGEAYARAELDDPQRMFTGTVRLRDCSGSPLLPVKTNVEIPRDSLFDVAKACRRIRVSTPIRMGDVIYANVAGTGADLIACVSCGISGVRIDSPLSSQSADQESVV